MWAAAGGLWRSRAGLRALFPSRDAALFPGCERGLHCSAVSCKNWLKKFASKTKKKVWYESPSLGSHSTYKPSKLEFLMRSTSKKTRKEDHARLRALNGLLYKALTDLLCTPEVSLTPDFSACRAYWKTTLSAEQNAHMEAVLQRSAAHMSLISYWQSQTLDPGMKETTLDPDAPQPCGITEPATSSSLCGIDHEALNKQIMEYKRRKDKGLRGLVWQGQVAELTTQMKKGRKRAKPRLEQDSSLKSYLSGEEVEDDLDLVGAPEYECYAPDTEELEAERGGGRTEDGHSCGATRE
ncbi:putative ribosome-binding factor A, mitochondrial isoform X5 [Gorilla gorilla gorilla]|uniref:putative ribosome-binding factor A, mitochondrial isoform X5 n=1 Tax=Gorilla gorilla gorilla TaxID=9595 RepID=UPI00300B50B0